MFAGITDHALEHAAGFDHFFGHGITVDLGAQLGGLFDRFGERDVEFVGDHLREAVGLGEGEVVHAGDVADDHLGAHGAIGDDVGDAVVAVFLAHVVDDFDAAAHAKIDIEVGGADALGVEESLEQQAEPHGIDVGDFEQVGDEAARAGSATGTDGDLFGHGPGDKIPDDEEVVHEAGDVDDRELVTEPNHQLLGLSELAVVRWLWLLALGEIH